MRLLQPRPCHGCVLQPDTSERDIVSGPIQQNCSMHAHPPQTPKTKRPRVWRPEGVRLASGDRVTDLHERSSVCLEHASLRFTRHNEARVATMAPVA